jgi:hypothetical protein
MGSFGESTQNEIGFSFIDASGTNVFRLLNVEPSHFYSNNAQSRIQPPVGAPVTPTPAGMYLVNEGPGSIRYMCGGPNQNQHPNPSMGVLVPAGGVIDWTNALINYSGMIRQFEFVIASGTQAVLQVSWRD